MTFSTLCCVVQALAMALTSAEPAAQYEATAYLCEVRAAVARQAAP
jgi:hypothetical protein